MFTAILSLTLKFLSLSSNLTMRALQRAIGHKYSRSVLRIRSIFWIWTPQKTNLIRFFFFRLLMNTLAYRFLDGDVKRAYFKFSMMKIYLFTFRVSPNKSYSPTPSKLSSSRFAKQSHIVRGTLFH